MACAFVNPGASEMSILCDTLVKELLLRHLPVEKRTMAFMQVYSALST